MLISDIIGKIDGLRFAINGERPFQYFALNTQVAPGDVCVFAERSEMLLQLQENVRMVITTPEVAEHSIHASYGTCVVEDPRSVFFQLHNMSSRMKSYVREEFATSIGEGSEISNLASIAKKNIRIGKDVLIEEFVVIREHTVIGDHTIIRAGSVIGGQGYEYKRMDGKILPVEHVGGVNIGAHVEIQYNTCIDRAVYPWDDTVIGDHTKIDNLVHIAHAAKIGRNVLVVANAGIAGRTVVGDDTWIGFGATISNGLCVGKNARANIGAVVTRDIEDNGSVTGNFAIEHKTFLRNLKASLR